MQGVPSLYGLPLIGSVEERVYYPPRLLDRLVEVVKGGGDRLALDASTALAVTEPSHDIATAALPALQAIAASANSRLDVPHDNTEDGLAAALHRLSGHAWMRLRLIVLDATETRVYDCTANALYPRGASLLLLNFGSWACVHFAGGPYMDDDAWAAADGVMKTGVSALDLPPGASEDDLCL